MYWMLLMTLDVGISWMTRASSTDSQSDFWTASQSSTTSASLDGQHRADCMDQHLLLAMHACLDHCPPHEPETDWLNRMLRLEPLLYPSLASALTI